MQHFSNFSSDDGTEKKEGGSGLRDAAIGGLLKKKPKVEEEQYNTQAQYSYQGIHFANFALGDTELGSLNRREYEKAKQTGDWTKYKQMQAQQKQAFDSNRMSAATQNAQAATQAKRAAAAEAKRVAGLGVGGKIKHYGGKALGVAGKLGGAALTASYVLPSLMSLMPQKPQSEEESPY